MKPSIAELAELVRDVVRTDRSRLEALHYLIGPGVEPSPEIAFAGLTRRLQRLEVLVGFLERLADYEAAIVALDPALTDPTMWR